MTDATHEAAPQRVNGFVMLVCIGKWDLIYCFKWKNWFPAAGVSIMLLAPLAVVRGKPLVADVPPRLVAIWLGKVDAGSRLSSPSRIAISAASIRRPRTDGGFMGYPKNKTAKLMARTRALKFLAAVGLEQMAGAVSEPNSAYFPAVSQQEESKNHASPADCWTEFIRNSLVAGPPVY